MMAIFYGLGYGKVTFLFSELFHPSFFRSSLISHTIALGNSKGVQKSLDDGALLN